MKSNRPAWMPSAHEVAREALILLVGAVLAAAVLGYVPQVKGWMRAQFAPECVSAQPTTGR